MAIMSTWRIIDSELAIDMRRRGARWACGGWGARRKSTVDEHVCALKHCSWVLLIASTTGPDRYIHLKFALHVSSVFFRPSACLPLRLADGAARPDARAGRCHPADARGRESSCSSRCARAARWARRRLPLATRPPHRAASSVAASASGADSGGSCTAVSSVETQ